MSESDQYEEEELIWEEEDDVEESEWENLYYTAKHNGDAAEAMKLFDEIIAGGDPSWSARSLKRICQMHLKAQNLPAFSETLLKLLNTIPLLGYSEAEKTVNKCSDLVLSHADSTFVNNTLTVLLQALTGIHARIGVTVLLKQCRRAWQESNLSLVRSLVQQVRTSCEMLEDHRKAVVELEVLSYEIQIALHERHFSRLQEMCPRAKCLLESTFPHPRIAGVVCDGIAKAHMLQNDFNGAQQEFFEAYKHLTEAGETAMKMKAVQCLFVCDMVSMSSIDRIDAPELRMYKEMAESGDHPTDPHTRETIYIIKLLLAFRDHQLDRDDLSEIANLVQQIKNSTLQSDPFIGPNVDLLLTTAQTMMLKKLIKPYQGHAVRINFLANKLCTTSETVMQLLVHLILENTLQGSIDEINMVLHLAPNDAQQGGCGIEYNVANKWIGAVNNISQRVACKVY